MEQEQRIKRMTEIMVTSRHANEDVGELVAAALQQAGRDLGNDSRLVTGRPGSWEADILLRMARTGGTGNAKWIKALAALFVEMGNAGVDGGDEVSYAMSQAVDDLGGLREFAGASEWYNDLVNIGCQYSRYEYMSAF
ncbi:MAG: hypothetical protein ACRDHW_00340 [Ktedonobacteraceae bacterium]